MQARETLEMLHLIHNNHAVLVENSPSFVGMLRTAQNFITWGEPSKETVGMMIRERGRMKGNKLLNDEYLQKAGFKSLEELSEAVFNCRVKYWKLPNIQPFFKLHPPSKGYRGKIKKSFVAGGELGYRGEKIDALLNRMF